MASVRCMGVKLMSKSVHGLLPHLFLLTVMLYRPKLAAERAEKLRISCAAFAEDAMPDQQVFVAILQLNFPLEASHSIHPFLYFDACSHPTPWADDHKTQGAPTSSLRKLDKCSPAKLVGMAYSSVVRNRAPHAAC
eukprot:1143450-Pelagomonas_calceolata.AAC.3